MWENDYQNTAGHTEGLSGAAEARLHQGDPASIGFAIHWNESGKCYNIGLHFNNVLLENRWVKFLDELQYTSN